MHPQIVRSGPGSCPICGMALEPRTVTLDERNPELEDMTRRFRLSALLTLPTVLLAMAEYLRGRALDSSLVPLTRMGPATWIQMVLTTPVVLWGGWPDRKSVV